ncbi:MAG: hypothetical protein QOE08_473, partial [Thermoleophilaceae bacterium]|nr:hypothetical protein [Thermoleophilaceae bacterium]
MSEAKPGSSEDYVSPRTPFTTS